MLTHDWKIDRSEPYQSEVIIEVLKGTWFKEKTSVGYESVRRYNQGLQGSTLIIPPGMVAIAATVVAMPQFLQPWSCILINP
jgi:hypothetical protein